MAAASLEDVKNIDQKTKDAIYGYIKQVQALFPSDNIYYTIPELVIYWCLLYYNQPERFDPKNCSHKFTLTEDNTVATQSDAGSMLLLLTNRHKTGIHEWKFKLVNKNHSTKIIGIFKTKYDADLATNLREVGKGKAYGWNLCTKQLTEGERYLEEPRYGEVCDNGDVITMILDLEALQLKYIVNGKDFGVAFDKIEATEYKATVSGYGERTVYKLLSYKRLK